MKCPLCEKELFRPFTDQKSRFPLYCPTVVANPSFPDFKQSHYQRMERYELCIIENIRLGNYFLHKESCLWLNDGSVMVFPNIIFDFAKLSNLSSKRFVSKIKTLIVMS
jgi:hypothetical protein